MVYKERLQGPSRSRRRLGTSYCNIYIKYVMIWVNYNNLATLRSATCKNYADDVAKLFKFRNFPSPVDFQDKTNKVTIIINNLKKEEDIATQRLPWDNRIHAELVHMGKESGVDSAEAVVSNIVSTGKSTGYRASEYSQKNTKESWLLQVSQWQGSNDSPQWKWCRLCR